MPRCTNKGCGKDYDQASNTSDSCIFHSGAPVFHEGLKSWSCCQDVNKPVLDFDEFMNIPGCMQGLHTDEAPKQEPSKAAPATTLSAKTDAGTGKETYSSVTAPAPLPAAPPLQPPPPPAEEEDDTAVPVAAGTICRRTGCGKSFISDEVSRHGDGPEAECVYHPKLPIFHEGSKGYLCCKRRVLEFDEFLKIEGCKKGKHVFAPKNQSEATEQFTDCRIDHYQTPTEVHVSVFAKKTDQERSIVTIGANEISLDLYLPGSKRFLKTVELFGPIDPEASSYKYYGTKVELVLKKRDTRSWAVLEKTEYAVPVNLTFGVGGRTGTIGSKQLILDNQNATKA
ncbi:chord-domain-containing protein [Trametopsis cervina]|nr:chord-domain-containing protein [Trametopsis cervina]